MPRHLPGGVQCAGFADRCQRGKYPDAVPVLVPVFPNRSSKRTLANSWCQVIPVYQPTPGSETRQFLYCEAMLVPVDVLRRYLVDHASLDAIERELRTGQATLAVLMEQAGIEVRARVAATAETRGRAKVEWLNGTSGPDGRSWGAYLQERALAGASLSALASESGRSRDWVRSVLTLLGLPAATRGPANE